MKEKDFNKIEVKNNICINVFGYENAMVFPYLCSRSKIGRLNDLLLLIDDDKSHYIYIKDFDRFIFHKTKNGNKKRFSSESVLIKHKENFLSINGKQSKTRKRNN